MTTKRSRPETDRFDVCAVAGLVLLVAGVWLMAGAGAALTVAGLVLLAGGITGAWLAARAPVRGR